MNQSESENKNAMSKRQLSAEEQQCIMRMKQKMRNSQPIFRSSGRDQDDGLKLAYDKNLENQNAHDLVNATIVESTGSANPDV